MADGLYDGEEGNPAELHPGLKQRRGSEGGEEGGSEVCSGQGGKENHVNRK